MKDKTFKEPNNPSYVKLTLKYFEAKYYLSPFVHTSIN